MVLILCSGHHNPQTWNMGGLCNSYDGQDAAIGDAQSSAFLYKRICLSERLCGTSPPKTRVGSSVRRCQSQSAARTAWRLFGSRGFCHFRKEEQLGWFAFFVFSFLSVSSEKRSIAPPKTTKHLSPLTIKVIPNHFPLKYTLNWISYVNHNFVIFLKCNLKTYIDTHGF